MVPFYGSGIMRTDTIQWMLSNSGNYVDLDLLAVTRLRPKSPDNNMMHAKPDWRAKY